MGDLQAQRPELNYKDNSFNLFLPLRVYFYECSRLLLSALNTETFGKFQTTIYLELDVQNVRANIMTSNSLSREHGRSTVINATTVKQSIKVVTPNFA